MPVVINEVEILDAPATRESAPSAAPSPARQVEPAHEQLRRLARDLEGRRRRLTAD